MMKRIRATYTMFLMWVMAMYHPEEATAVIRDGMLARNARITCEAAELMAEMKRPKLRLVKS